VLNNFREYFNGSCSEIIGIFARGGIVGFYFRKSINLGFLRINFSKSGVGFSLGVPGFRLVKPAKGKVYLHVGKSGFYYRKSLGEQK